MRPDGRGPRRYHPQARVPNCSNLGRWRHDRERWLGGISRPGSGPYVRTKPRTRVAMGRIPSALAGEGVRAYRLELGGN